VALAIHRSERVFVIFDYGIDGYAFKVLADAWAAASEPDKAQLQQMAEFAMWFLNGTFRSEILIAYGLTVLIAGVAVACDGWYPVWFGWIGARPAQRCRSTACCRTRGLA
jgi:hypothetical protein